MNISLVADFVKYNDFLKNIQIIKKAGFSHINLSTHIICSIAGKKNYEIKEFKSVIEDTGLKIDWIHAPFFKINFYTDDNEYRSVSIYAVKKIIDIGDFLNANSIVVHPVNDIYPDDIFNSKYSDNILEAYKVLIDHSRDMNIKIAIENLINNNIHQLTMHILDNIKSLKLCFDTGHAAISKTFDFYMPKYLDRIIALHIHDNNGLEDQHLIPGEGIIDFYIFFKMLPDEYKGVIGIESMQHKSGFPGTPEEIAGKIIKNIHNFIK